MIIDNDYYMVMAPMSTILKLRGIDLVVFAVIHSFSKDGKHKYQGSAEDIAAKWLGDKNKARSVKDSIKVLSEAGYINIYPSYIGKKRHNVYDTNYNQLLMLVEAGEPLPALSKKMRGSRANSGMIPPVVSATKIGGICNKNQWYNTTHINILNIINIISGVRGRACASREEQQQEIYLLFYWKGAVEPRREVEAFYRYNDSRGWSDGQGRAFDTFEKVIALADGWKFEQAGTRNDTVFLATFCKFWALAVTTHQDIAWEFINPAIRAHVTAPLGRVEVYITSDIYRWLEQCKEAVQPQLTEMKRQLGVKTIEWVNIGGKEAPAYA